MNRSDAPVDIIAWLLRAPAEVAARCRRDEDTRALIGILLAAIVTGSAAFGAALGSFRGGLQIAYAAFKLPIAVIAALVVCVPALHALTSVLVRPWPLRAVLAVMLASLARASLILLALTPALWLGIDLGMSYHDAVLVAAAAYGVSGLFGLSVLFRGIGVRRANVVALLSSTGVFLLALGQTSWLARPYLLRPQTEEIPFLRSVEGGYGDALHRSYRSSTDRFDRPSAPVRDCRGAFRCK
ncbi:MAG: hypothetical protein AAF928_00365 [Myxococcota bacterium]